ncbi:MAG: adenylate cyclase [Gaiellales bacterium]|jgi:adenylate cyclase|nr:adenylate cyclase [Gaiellales bacterium]
MTGAQGEILVVDDDPLNRAILRRGLERAGHVVSTAENGIEALAAMRAGEVDLVLLDIVMPHMDGFQVLDEMKGDAALCDIPVIMISAVDDHESVIRCIETGAEDHLPKPFDPVLLRARINAGLARKRLHALERERLRDVFARFLPAAVVEEVLLRGAGDPRLGGVRLDATAMFCDLRGFTTFAERTPPDRVIDVLNRYLGEMADAVLDAGGTLVGFLGDGLLAVFGAPIPAADHADQALTAVRAMLTVRLPRFNEWAREQGFGAGFRMGVGLDSGSLMSGNVGSERRLEYTAIGDTVNTASRIEQLTKEYPFGALLSDDTRRLLTVPADDLTLIGDVAIRGRAAPTVLWGLGAA